jgi:hypothetical protein
MLEDDRHHYLLSLLKLVVPLFIIKKFFVCQHSFKLSRSLSLISFIFRKHNNQWIVDRYWQRSTCCWQSKIWGTKSSLGQKESILTCTVTYPQKVVLHSITARFFLRPYHFAISLTFKHLSRDFEKTTITAMYHGRWFTHSHRILVYVHVKSV